MNYYNKQKGFTLIELLVVIAIIGVLSSVVLAVLNIARAKGANASVKANLHGIRAQAEIIHDSTEDYSTVCSDTNVVSAVVSAMTAANDSVGLTNYTTNNDISNRCNATATEWAVNVLLKIPDGANNYWCVDQSGKALSEPNELSGATLCV